MGSDIPSLVGGNYKPINQGSEIMNGFGYYWGEKKAASLSKPDHSCLAIQARCKEKKKKKEGTSELEIGHTFLSGLVTVVI